MSFGVTGQALKWIESYLSNRTQFVKLQQEVSDTHNLDTGVPQGSCLGPFLFCVYVSTLANVVPEGVSFHQYADDVQLYCGIRTSDFIGDIKILEDCTVAIEQWFLSNGMLLNANKSDSVVVSTSAQANKIPANAVITVAGHAIKPAISLRSLGVIIDDRLSFKQHVSEVSRSCYYHIRAFRHIRHCLSYETSCAVSRCIVLSRLDYCNSLLHGTSKDNIYKLQKIQNSLVRIIYNLPSRSSTQQSLITLHWLPVHERIIYKVALFAYKCKNELAPTYLSDLIINYVPPRQLRSSDMNLLVQPRVNTATANRGFSVAAPRIWNSLPMSVRATQNLNAL